MNFTSFSTMNYMNQDWVPGTSAANERYSLEKEPSYRAAIMKEAEQPDPATYLAMVKLYDQKTPLEKSVGNSPNPAARRLGSIPTNFPGVEQINEKYFMPGRDDHLYTNNDRLTCNEH